MSLKANIQIVETIDIREQVLSRQYIMETLSIYKTQHIYLDSAKWNGSELIGWFRLEHYPFTKEEHIDYVTASMLMLYLSQLGYIYARILCERNLLPSSVKITIQDFFRLRDEGNIVFVALDNIRFHQRIPISDSLLQIKMRLNQMYVVKGNLIGALSFEVAERVFSGSTRVAIILMN